MTHPRQNEKPLTPAFLAAQFYIDTCISFDTLGNILRKNKHRGSDLRALLSEDGVLEAVEARAVKRALALQLARLAAEQSLSKSEMAARMNTSRAAVDRLLDASNPSVTLTTLGKAARRARTQGQDRVDTSVESPIRPAANSNFRSIYLLTLTT